MNIDAKECVPGDVKDVVMYYDAFVFTHSELMEQLRDIDAPEYVSAGVEYLYDYFHLLVSTLIDDALK